MSNLPAFKSKRYKTVAKVFVQGVVPETRGRELKKIPSRRGGGGREVHFISWFRLNFCVRVFRHSIISNTNVMTKNNLLYLLTFIDKLINFKGCSMWHGKLQK